MDSNPISVPNLCEWCGGAGTCRCGRCHVVYYCSRDHQMQHWAIHKKICKKSSPPVMPSTNICHNMLAPSNINQMPLSSSMNQMPSSCNINHTMQMPSTSSLSFSPSANWNQSNVYTSVNEDISQLPVCGNLLDPHNSSISSEKLMDFNIACADEILSSITNDFLSSDNSFWNLIDTCNAQNVSDLDLYFTKDVINQMPVPQNSSSPSNISNANSPCIINDEDVNLIECAPLSDICRNVIHDLNMYGICVLDKFIGSKHGNLVLEEVKNLYSTGIFEKGKLVKSSAYIASESIRSDVTTWVDGTEPYCQNIGYLIQKLDLVIATCNKMQHNGQLSKYKLHRRTKAMVACYPGNRTNYKKHVDNPNKDGRCITCIYYLNKNWDVKKHGGILRMFPSVRESDVAQIEPIFDRMIFFWSDRRNPHEVLPAFAMRFAITVWYFDADERDAALKVIQEKSQHSQSSSFS